jgi:hypothetical protein
MSDWLQGFIAGGALVPLGIVVLLASLATLDSAVKAVYRAFDGFLFLVAVTTGFFMPFALWRALGYDTLFAARLVLLRGEQMPRSSVRVFERVVRTYRGAKVFLFHCRRAYLDGESSPRKIADVGMRAAVFVKQ